MLCKIKKYYLVLTCSSCLLLLTATHFVWKNFMPIGNVHLNTFEVRLIGPVDYDDANLLRYIKRNYLSPPSNGYYNLSTDNDYKIEAHESSWPLIDNYTKTLFGNKRGGFFVEAGALDGEYLSNTLWLEQELGWNGLLVEPDHRNYQELLLKRRKCWSSNSCLSLQNYPSQMILESLKTHSAIQDMGWIARANDHLVGVTTDPLIIEKMHEMTFQSYSKVQCFPLASILLTLNITSVDLFILDVQGAEIDILESFPWDRIDVKVVIVEQTVHLVNKKLLRILNGAGLALWKIEGEPDYYFVKRNDPLFADMKLIYLQDTFPFNNYSFYPEIAFGFSSK